MKKILFSLILSSSVACIASAAEVDFTYAQGELSSYGKNKKETVDVAICISDPTLAGKKITSISAYISTIEGIEETSVWLSSELTLTNKVNDPDLGSFEATPVETNFEGQELGLLSVELENPYVLTDQPIYVGYSMNITETKSDEQKKPVVISEGANINGLFLHMNKSIQRWSNYSENENAVAFIVVTLEGEFPQYSADILNNSPVYASKGEDFDIEFFISNKGLNPIENITYTYSYQGSDQVYSGNAVLPEAIQPSLATTTPVTLSFDGLSEPGAYTMEFSITQVNGQPNDALLGFINPVVNVMPFEPTHRPLMEEYTGLWCGWCPGGYIALELIQEKYGDDVVVVSYHNGDPMQITSDYPVNITAFPTATIDRYSIIDPYWGDTDEPFGVAYNLEDTMAQLAVAEINLDTELEGDMVNVNTSVTFVLDIDNANYQIGYTLVSNNLSNKSWAQTNYYTGEKGYEGTELEQLTEWPEKVFGLVFNDVAVDIEGYKGVENSLPEKINVGQEYTHQFSYNIADNDLIQNPEDLVVTAFIIDKNNNKIINANKSALGNTTAVKNIEKVSDIKPVETQYFDLAGRRIVKPSNGIYIVKEIMSDGSYKTHKSVIR
ncbi:MAG: Omp28-related outer membrane protein [Muribaculaceae bacterium]|nr:Omp28-related outer membrane protein [Muribaculaceae bacterium]